MCRDQFIRLKVHEQDMNGRDAIKSLPVARSGHNVEIVFVILNGYIFYRVTI